MSDEPRICVECGDDEAVAGHAYCLDCLERLYPDSDPEP